MLFWLSFNQLLSQFSEDFSDGELTRNPRWWGETSRFRINEEGYLQLDDNNAGTAFLSAILGQWQIDHWSFKVKMDFNPSANNFCKIYLTANGHKLHLPLNGYFIMIGGKNDEVSLYRQDGASITKILNGPDGILDSSSVEIKVEIDRSDFGKWDLQVTDVDTDTLLMTGMVDDSRYNFSYFFGISCTYTATRADKFYFDDIVATGILLPDTQPPTLNALEARDSVLLLQFNEPIWPDLSASQFMLNGLPVVESAETDNKGMLCLQLSELLRDQTSYRLTVENLSDLAGNRTTFQHTFNFFPVVEPAPFGLIITEIMADPDPPVANLNTEYIELYNRTAQPFYLGNVRIADQTKAVTIPEFVLHPGEFLILYPQSNNIDWSDSTNSLGLASWPSLNNDGDMISLLHESETIHRVNYTNDWYRSDIKKHGGWSLEMIDSNYPCSGASNWSASVSNSGGTPGFLNSIHADNPDLTAPEVINTFAVSPDTLCVVFNEIVNTDLNQTAVIIDQGITVSNLLVDDPDFPKVTVVLKEPLSRDVIYQMQLLKFADCHGNRMTDQGVTVAVALPSQADSADLLISEVLFNPWPLGTRFVEIHNPSEKAYDLKDIRLARIEDDLLVDFRLISDQPLMIYPGEYKALTENIRILQSQYTLSNISGIVEVKDLPSLPDRQGSIVINNLLGVTLDKFEYHQDMHHLLLVDKNGVSLERISFRLPANLRENWASASELAGYATPGLPNSQMPGADLEMDFEISPDILDRRKQGQSSYVQIRYQFSSPGKTISISVYDAQGRNLVKLLENSIAGTEGLIFWDGADNNNTPLKMGFYLVVATALDLNGSVRLWKKPLVIAPNY